MTTNIKTILCYGDSNTWGWNPATQDRHSRDERWTGVLRRALGDGYLIVEEGLNGRTTVWDDPIEGYKSGKEYLIPCLLGIEDFLRTAKGADIPVGASLIGLADSKPWY